MSGHIVLVGLSGGGKTTLGRLLADARSVPFYDTDTLLAERAGEPAFALLRRDPAGFRAVEEEVIAAACAAPPGVIATGGGGVLSAHNREQIARDNTVVWLRGPLDLHLRRIAGGEARPALEGADAAVLMAQRDEERRALYAAVADITIDACDEPPEATLARMIVALDGVRDATRGENE